MWYFEFTGFPEVKKSGGDGDFEASVAESWSNQSTRYW